MKLFYPVIFFLFYSIRIFSQDIHFTQYINTPLTVNPAYTALFDSDYRVSAHYRTQWGAIAIPYKTIMICADKKFEINRKRFGAGLLYINDRSGHVFLVFNKILASASYQTSIWKNNFSFGVQGGYVLNSFDESGIIVPDQYNFTSRKYDPSMPTNESFNVSNGYFIVNAGAIWSRKIDKMTPEFGFSLYNVNTPKASFWLNDTASNGNRIYIRKVFKASIDVEMGSKFTVTPAFISLMQGKAIDEIPALFVAYALNKEKMQILSAGLLYRENLLLPNDAINILAGVQISKYYFGISYDINVSKLRVATNYQGAFEISFIYKEMNTKTGKYMIPCDRL